MRAFCILTPIILLAFAGSFLAKSLLVDSGVVVAPDAGQCERIVSMAPSITETLFALGLGDRVVGVTRYCRYPAEARQEPEIGGYLDPNFEAIVALRPDLIVMLADGGPARRAFDKLRLPTLVVCHKTVDGILDSISTIGCSCGAERRGEEIVAEIRLRMKRIRRKTSDLPRRRVLIAVDRTFGRGGVEDAYFAGRDGQLDRMIELAGGQNGYRAAARFPIIAAEGILQINPQVIVDVVPESKAAEIGKEAILADWRQVAGVDAVKHGRVYVLADDRASLPGPGFIRTVEHLARLIHPEVDW